MSKKALYIPLQRGYGGAERRLVRVFNRLNNGGEWIIIFNSNSRLVKEFCEKEKVNEESVVVCSGVLETIKYMFKSRLSVIWYFNVDKVALLLSILKKFNLIKASLIMTVANFYYSRLEFPSKKVRKAFYYAARKATIIDCLYPSSKEILENVVKCKKVNITPIPFTLPELYYPKAKKNIIVFASRFIREKNPIMLLQAVENIKDIINKYSYKVYMCGTGALKNEIEEFVKEHKLNNIVEIKGYVNTEDILPNSKIYLSIMEGENYPSQSLIEAISCGNYCIVGKGYDSKKMLDEGFGEIIELNNNDLSISLANSIKVCEEYGDKVIQEACTFAKRNFNINNSVDYYKKIFESVRKRYE